MIKNYLRKISLLVTILGMALINPTTATEDRKEQNQRFAKSLFLDAVVKKKEFKDLWDEYMRLSSDNLDEGKIPQLLKGMQAIYNNYCESKAFKDDIYLEPYLPEEGPYSFLTGQRSQPFGNVYSGDEHDNLLHITYLNLGDNSLAPAVDPTDIMQCINQYLFPHYSACFMSNFQSVSLESLGLTVENQATILKHKDHLMDLIDPRNMIVFLRLLNDMPEMEDDLAPNLTWEMNNIRMMFSDRFLPRVCGIKNGEFIFKTGFYKDLEKNIQPWFGHMLTQERQDQLKKSILKKINQTYNILDKQYLELPQDEKALNSILSHFVNTLYDLTRIELSRWENVFDPKLDQIKMAYSMAMQKLVAPDEDSHFYLGVTTSPYSIALTEVPVMLKDQFNVKREDLRTMAQTHYDLYKNEVKAYDKKLEQYEEVKPHLGILRATVEWLDEIYGYLKKKGEIS